MARVSSFLCVAAAFVALGAGPAAAVTIVNGDFADTSGQYTVGAPFDTLFAGSTALSGWTVGGNSVDWVQSYWQASPGASYSIDLSGNADGSLSQVLTGLTAGTTYTVKFDLSGNPDGGPFPKPLGVSAASTSQEYYYGGASSRSAMNYEIETFAFVANGTSDTLEFKSDSGTPFGPVIGSVVVGVPEPSTWALMAFGFAAVAFASYRGKRAGLAVA